LTAILVVVSGSPLGAVVSTESRTEIGSRAFVSERLLLRPVLQAEGAAAASLLPAVGATWSNFRAEHPRWSAVFDRRSGVLEMAEGDGIPLLPGRGNELTKADIAEHLGGKKAVDLAVAESAVRAYLPRVASLIGVDPASLVLDAGRSGQPTPNLWNVDYNVTRDGLVVEGARVIFRIGHGNLIQFGGENLPSPGAAVPAASISKESAKDMAAAAIGGFAPTDSFLDSGSLHLVPMRVDDANFAEGFEAGRGVAAHPVWQFIFRRVKESETWRIRVDAVSGEVLELVDTNDYAQVTGGAQSLGVETVRPMPYADVTPGGFANSAGVFPYTSGLVTSKLQGQYVGIIDLCGSLSQSIDPDAVIAFGASGGTDCTTPGNGGLGNSHSARTQFYHLNRAKEVARGWLPGAWLSNKLYTQVNIPLTCNAFWNGGTVNFYRSGGGCNNTGEIEAVSLHEYGHGLDSNDGGAGSPDRGTGETYGDFTAALATHSSCIGTGFRATNCGGYSNACTACTGVRDIDWAKHTANLAHTVDNFTRPNCPTSATYQGPCLKEGHCESYVSSEALWDFTNRDLPGPGSGAAWTLTDRLWYLSRPSATAAFACTTGATYTSNGCNAGSLWKTMRAVDDDDGNLANGTPNSAALYAAFNRHGIACTSDPGANVSFRGCTQPASPTLLLTPGNNQMTVAWTGAGGAFDVYRNEVGCNAGFTKIGNDLAGPSLVDNDVANGATYYYQVVEQPVGNEACASAPSSCQSASPVGPVCVPPGVPTGLAATGGDSQISLTWNAEAGATSYNVLRSTTLGGTYELIAQPVTNSYVDPAPSCGQTFFYKVQSSNAAGCHSASSAASSASTNACAACVTQTLYSKDFETGTGLDDWTVGSFSGPTTDWRGIQTCTAHGGTKVFRFGGTGCTTDYADNSAVHTYAQPAGASGIAIPPSGQTNRLTFWHRRGFEDGFDGGTLKVSVDGINYAPVPESAMLSGSFGSGAIAGDCPPANAAGLRAFTGTSGAFTQTVVDLDAACNAASGGTEGCAGQSVRIAFTAVTDCNTTGDGWFLDDVAVSSCASLLLNDSFESGTLSAWSGFSP
jgi:hypothetical protein